VPPSDPVYVPLPLCHNTLSNSLLSHTYCLLLLIISEIIEAFEEYRDGHAAQEIYYPEVAASRGLLDSKSGKPEGLPMELADTCIRIFDLSKRLNIDLEECIAEKLDYNLTRSERHGGKIV